MHISQDAHRIRLRIDVQRVEQPRGAEHVPVLICGFRHAVRVDEQLGAGLQPDLILRVVHAVHSAQNKSVSVLQERERTVRVPDHRIFVSRVRRGQSARGDLKDADPRGDEHFRPVVRADRFVGLPQDLRRGVLLHGVVRDDGLGDHHEQRARDAFSRHVRHDEAEMVIVHQKEIVEVSAYLAGGIHARVKIELGPVGKRGKLLRQRVVLDPRRQRQLHADALRFRRDPADLIQMIVDLLRQVDHFFRKLPDLVSGSDLGQILPDHRAVLRLFVQTDILLDLRQRIQHDVIHQDQTGQRQDELSEHRDRGAADRTRHDVRLDPRLVVCDPDKQRVSVHHFEVFVAVHVLSGVRKMLLVQFCLPHGLLQALPYRRHRPERIDLLVLRAACGARIRRAEEEELRVVGLVRDRAEKKIHPVSLLDLVDPCDQPGIGDFRVEFSVLRRHVHDVLRGDVSDLKARIMLRQDPAFFQRLRRFAESDVVFDVQIVRILIPVAQEPPVGGILLHRQDHFVRGSDRQVFHIPPDRSFGRDALHRVHDAARHENSRDKQDHDLTKQAPVFLLSVHHAPPAFQYCYYT